MSINKYIKFFDSGQLHYRGHLTQIDDKIQYEDFTFKIECLEKDWNFKKQYLFLGTLDSALNYGDLIIVFKNIHKINLLNFANDNKINAIKYIKKLSLNDRFMAYCLQSMYGLYNNIESFNKFGLSSEQIINETINYFKNIRVQKINIVECSILCLLLPYGLSNIIRLSNKNINEYIIKINNNYNNEKINMLLKFIFIDGRIKIYIEYHNKFSKIYIVDNNNLVPVRVSYMHLDRLVIKKFNSKCRKIIYKNNSYKISGIYNDDPYTNIGICKIIMDILKLLNIEKHGNTCIDPDYVVFNNIIIKPKYIIIKKYDDVNDDLIGYILQKTPKCILSGVTNIKLSNYKIYNTLDEIINLITPKNKLGGK